MYKIQNIFVVPYPQADLPQGDERVQPFLLQPVRPPHGWELRHPQVCSPRLFVQFYLRPFSLKHWAQFTVTQINELLGPSTLFPSVPRLTGRHHNCSVLSFYGCSFGVPEWQIRPHIGPLGGFIYLIAHFWFQTWKGKPSNKFAGA